MFQVLTLCICQLFLCFVLTTAISWRQPDYGTVSINVYGAKFICGLALHLLVTDNEQQGLRMVKHTLNHKYKFKAYGLVALVGFM